MLIEEDPKLHKGVLPDEEAIVAVFADDDGGVEEVVTFVVDDEREDELDIAFKDDDESW